MAATRHMIPMTPEQRADVYARLDAVAAEVMELARKMGFSSPPPAVAQTARSAA